MSQFMNLTFDTFKPEISSSTLDKNIAQINKFGIPYDDFQLNCIHKKKINTENSFPFLCDQCNRVSKREE